MTRGRYRVSFAQNKEDIFIDAFFPDTEKGFYVDIGANHPEQHSVTRLFYKKGWRGINIEPNPAMLSLIKKDRPEDINLGVGVAQKNGQLRMRLYHSQDGLDGLSTLSTAIQDSYTAKTDENTTSYSDIKIQVRTLRDIFNELRPEHINFMKVDVEGFEYEVLSGNDWEKYRPELICIEANHIVHDWRPILKDNGYSKVFNDGLNDYYLANESRHRANDFSYAGVILAGLPVLYFDVYDQLVHQESELSKLEKNLTLAGSENSKLRQHIEYLNSEIVKQRRLREQIKMLLRNLDKIINLRIEHLRHNNPSAYDAQLRLVNQETSAEQALSIIQETDKEAFSKTEGNNLSYRITKRIYLVFRWLGKSMFKAVSRIKRTSAKS